MKKHPAFLVAASLVFYTHTLFAAVPTGLDAAGQLQLVNDAPAATDFSFTKLANGKTRFLGAVLNRVDLQHHGYYYSQYYRREYGDYYQKHESA